MREMRITKAWLARTNKRKEKEKTKKFVNGELTKIYSWFLLLGTNVVIFKIEKRK